MYVCICYARTDKDIEDQIACGNTSLNKIGRGCGAGRDCGSCVGKIRALLDSAATAQQSGCPAAGPVQPVA